jgi:oligoendopeptidase F
MERLRRYDLGAPVSDSETEIRFDDAVHLVFESFHEFDPQLALLARRVLDDGHYDAEVRPGKRSGAFCASVTPDMTPYVLQSYTGRPRDVATMAHELGHAIHSLMSSRHTALTFRSSLPLAETASTFSEMLLVDKLVSQTDDPAVRRELLARQMDDNYATIGRQAYFALFERDAHAAIREGAAVDGVSALYLQNLRAQFGDAVDVSDDFAHEWVAVPHFYHTPFYVYAYAFGQLLVLALYRRYQEEGATFKPRYREILAAGGSASPEQILQRAGIDMRSEAFWQSGFDVLAERLRQLSTLAKAL